MCVVLRSLFHAVHPPGKIRRKEETEKYKKYTLSYFFRSFMLCFFFCLVGAKGSFFSRSYRIVVYVLRDVWKIIATKIQLKMGSAEGMEWGRVRVGEWDG